MADIAHITLPSGDTYDIKDEVARQGMTLLSYGSSTWNDFITAYNANKIVYCRASSNADPAVGNQLRLAFMAYINAATPTEVEFQYYRSVSSHTDKQQGDQVYVYKLNSSSTWSVILRNAFTKVVAGTDLSSSYNNGEITINHATSGVTAGSKGDTTNQTPTWGGTFKSISSTVTATGHLTSLEEHTVTIPNSVATTSADGLMSSTDKTTLNTISTNLGNHTVLSDVPANAVFTDTTYTGTSPITISGTAISHANSGVTAASKGDTTAQTPTWGGTFKALSGTVNATGHLTAFAEHTVTIPSAVATSSANGLMSSTDKSALDSLQTYVNNMILAGINKTVAKSAWTSSGEATYLYKADVTMTGVDSSYFPIVEFKDADLDAYIFSPKVVPKTNAVTIYCVNKPTATITIPNIVCVKGKAV